jgi:hypothetical protein
MSAYVASQDWGLGITLLVDGETYLADGPPKFWRVTAEGNLIKCMECREIVDFRPKDLVLWCQCAECPIVFIEDTLDDPADPEDS